MTFSPHVFLKIEQEFANFEPKRNYTFKKRAMNAEGWGEFSHEISSSTDKLYYLQVLLNLHLH